MINQADCPCCGEGAFYEVQLIDHPKVLEPLRNLVFTCPNACQDDPANLATFLAFLATISDTQQ